MTDPMTTPNCKYLSLGWGRPCIHNENRGCLYWGRLCWFEEQKRKFELSGRARVEDDEGYQN